MVIAGLNENLINTVLTNKREKVMKKGTLIIISVTILTFIGCARDKLYEDALMGTWKAYSIEINGKWVNIPSNMQMSITINPIGTYSTSGYLGQVSGTWHLSKRNLTFNLGEQEYMICYVAELWQDKCEFEMTLNNEIIRIKCNKKVI